MYIVVQLHRTLQCIWRDDLHATSGVAIEARAHFRRQLPCTQVRISMDASGLAIECGAVWAGACSIRLRHGEGDRGFARLLSTHLDAHKHCGGGGRLNR